MQDRYPLTKSLAIYSATVYLAAAFGVGGKLFNILIFNSRSVLPKPWSLFTYPLSPAGGGIFSFAFSLLWFWIAAGSLERSWGTNKFSIFLLLNTAVSALGLSLAGLLSGSSISASALWLPLAGVTMAFAAINPNESILFAFVIPLKLKYLALITVGFVLYSYLSYGFVAAVLALAGCAFSLWYAKGNGLEIGGFFSRKESNIIRVYPKKSILDRLNFLRKIRENRERKRLRDLFERSGIDEK